MGNFEPFLAYFRSFSALFELFLAFILGEFCVCWPADPSAGGIFGIYSSEIIADEEWDGGKVTLPPGGSMMGRDWEDRGLDWSEAQVGHPPPRGCPSGF